MKAAVWHNKKDIQIKEVPDPIPGRGQVKARVKSCGICGSDLHEYDHGPQLIPSDTDGKGRPVVLGHELSAEIVELGQDVRRFKVGDRITTNPLIYCRECPYCRQGTPHLCPTIKSKGLAEDGGFAEYVLLNEYGLHELPPTISDDIGALVEPLSVAVHAVKRSRFRIGDTVAVIGAGPIGLLVLQVCRAAGARQTFVVEPMKARRELAGQLGAGETFDPGSSKPAKAIRDATDGWGADIAIDCVGSQSSFDVALKATRRRGVICVAGVALKPISVPFGQLLAHEKEVIFTNAYEDDFRTSLALLADGRVDVESLISARISLDDLVEKGMKALLDHADRYVKILVHP